MTMGQLLEALLALTIGYKNNRNLYVPMAVNVG